MYTNHLRFPALSFCQKNGRRLFAFAAPGNQLSGFLTVSRIARNEAYQTTGYQRPEILTHIEEIKAYLRSEKAMLPNALVVAFEQSVTFEPISPGNFFGELVIPIQPNVPEHRKPGWVVDGQQRMAALREAVDESFQVCIIAFIVEEPNEPQEQFVLVNATRPLPKSLIYELLPELKSPLPSFLQRRQLPASLMQRLNFEEDSPFYLRIKMPTNPEGVIKDNSILRMLENSLSDGALYYSSRDGNTDPLEVVKTFWHAVAEVFPEAWALPPQRSRLTHGAGIVSMGFIMDAITDRYIRQHMPTRDQFVENLEPLRDICRWTSGYWDFGQGNQRKWNEIQNTSKDIKLLANFLMIYYRSRVWNRPAETLEHNH